jgi:hypothetical protein
MMQGVRYRFKKIFLTYFTRTATLAMIGLVLAGLLIQKRGQTHSKDPLYIRAVETINDNEAAAINTVGGRIVSALKNNYPPGVRPMRRDAHAKHHGCVKAIFQVHNQGLPPELRVGVFAKNRVFPAWIRFSNASTDIQMDRFTDGRGMAIKLMGVANSKILPDEKDEKTQDFVLANTPVFPLDTPAEYLSISSEGGKTVFHLFKYYLTHPAKIFVLAPLLFQTVSNPLSIRYWSITPYALGPAAVKYSAIPCSMEDRAKIDKTHENYLREAMAATLHTSEVCFQFMVQLQNNAEKMPIELPTVNWDEKRSPFISVATILIFSQTFESEAQMEFCENISFTPWHSLPEHRPLGGLNRARKGIYQTISTLRHKANNAPRVEPEPVNWPQ